MCGQQTLLDLLYHLSGNTLCMIHTNSVYIHFTIMSRLAQVSNAVIISLNHNF